MTRIYRNILVLTGAGISAESGLATFRSSNGLWNNHRVEDVASIEGFERNPALVHDFYNENVDMNTAYNDIVNSFTPEYFRNLAARIIADGNIFEVIMDPTATEAE